MRVARGGVVGRAVVLIGVLVVSFGLLATPAAAVPPSNDTFAGARVVGDALPFTVSAHNLEATKEPGEPDHGGQPGGSSIWFSWTPTESGTVAVDNCFQDFGMDSVIGVYTGGDVASLSEVAGNDDGCPFSFPGRSRVVFDAIAGTTYFIAVDGVLGEQTSIELTFSDGTPPANDDLADAQELAGALPLVVGGSNINATKELGEPTHASTAGGASVWYSWTADANRAMTVDTCSGAGDSVMAVYVGNSVDALTPIAANDDGCTGGLQSNVAWLATSGTTYLIAVDGFARSPAGLFDFTLTLDATAPPANDDFTDAQLLEGPFPLVLQSTNVGATKEPGEPAHAGNAGGASVWYRWTADATQDLEIDTCAGFGFDAVLAVYTGDAVDDLQLVVSNDDTCGLQSLVELSVTEGVTYSIAVDGFNGAQGTFALTVTDAASRPSNDDFDDAVELTGALPISVQGNTSAATSEFREPTHEVFHTVGHSVWYRWTADITGPVAVDTCEGTTYTSAVAVFTGTEVAALSQVQADQGECGFFAWLTLDAVAGTTYSIAVDESFPGGTGDFTLRIRTGPAANDNLASAIELSGGPLPVALTAPAAEANKEEREPNPEDGSSIDTSGWATVWYAWTPAESRRVTIDTCDGTIGAHVNVYGGTSYDDLAVVRLGAGSTCGGSQATFDAEAGQPYLLQLTLSSDEGQYALTIRDPSPPPANDDFANARVLNQRIPQVVHASNVDASTEPGEPEIASQPGGASIWYAWTAPRTMPVAVETCGSEVGTLLGVFTGSAVDALDVVTSDRGIHCFGNGAVQFDAVAGTRYHIVVDGNFGVHNAIRLTLRPALVPANDDFANARVLGGKLPLRVSGSTADATFEPGEPPDYAGGGLGRSVWYRWTAARTGDVVVETCGSDNISLVSVWTGTSPAELERVPGEQVRFCGDQFEWVSSRFPATKGTTYSIAVDGELFRSDEQGLDQVGPFTLTLRVPRAPANDDLASAQALAGPLPIAVRGSNREATPEPSDPTFVVPDIFATTRPTVWYRWTATVSEPVVVETCGSSFDSTVGVFTGDVQAGLTPVSAEGDPDEPDNSCGIFQSRFRLIAETGTAYLIGVAGIDDNLGDLRLRLRRSAPPANDAFASAQPLTVPLPIGVRTNNADATVEDSEPLNFYRSTLWYSWTATESGPVVADTCASDRRMRAGISVFTGGSLDALVPAGERAHGCGEDSTVRFTAESGTTYRIQVGTFGSRGQVRFGLRQPDPPPNDDLADARVLSSPRTLAGNNVDATSEPGERRHAGAGAGASVWWSWTPRLSSQVAIDTCGSSVTTALAVYVEGTTTPLRRLTASSATACNNRSLVVFPAAAGVTLFIAVDGFEDRFGTLPWEGPLRLRFTCDPGPCS